MSGLGGLKKLPKGVVMGMVQLPVMETPKDLAAQARRICDRTAKARRNMGTMDLVVFPEYSLHGLSMDTNPADPVPAGWPGSRRVPVHLHAGPCRWALSPAVGSRGQGDRRHVLRVRGARAGVQPAGHR